MDRFNNQPQPAQQQVQPQKFKKRSSKAFTEWIKLCRKMGYCQTFVDPNTGKKVLKNVPKKGTPQYAEVRKEWDKIKAKGY